MLDALPSDVMDTVRFTGDEVDLYNLSSSSLRSGLLSIFFFFLFLLRALRRLKWEEPYWGSDF